MQREEKFCGINPMAFFGGEIALEMKKGGVYVSKSQLINK
jgi:hypothetical protein